MAFDTPTRGPSSLSLGLPAPKISLPTLAPMLPIAVTGGGARLHQALQPPTQANRRQAPAMAINHRQGAESSRACR